MCSPEPLPFKPLYHHQHVQQPADARPRPRRLELSPLGGVDEGVLAVDGIMDHHRAPHGH